MFTGPANSMVIDFFKFTYLTRFGYKLILIAKYFTHRSPTISAVLLLRGDPKTIKKWTGVDRYALISFWQISTKESTLYTAVDREVTKQSTSNPTADRFKHQL